MLIKPYEKMPDRYGLNKIKPYYGECGEICYDLIHRISINPDKNVGRLEKITLATDEEDPENTYIVKECATGPMKYNKFILHGEPAPSLRVENYTYVTTDIDGEYLQSGGLSQYPTENEIDSYVEYGFNDLDTANDFIVDEDYFKKKINKSIEFTNLTMNNIREEVLLYENKFQLPYTETIGFLDTFFSTWTFNYPFECYIIIDPARRIFNIPKIKYLPFIKAEEMKAIYSLLVMEVDRMSNYLFRVFERERRHLKIVVFLHPFGSVIKLIDMDMHREEKFNVYTTGQVQSLMKNVITDGVKYFGSESFGILRQGPKGEVMENALVCCDALC
jgi:hypothetical protein